MGEIGEGLGNAIEGGLIARAVEKSAGEASASSPGSCLNCAAELTGPYCHQCGQKAKVHRTISAIRHDIIHGALHLDGKLWRTLPLLAFRPGQITRRYIDGERARFVSPMAMFLFSVFLMFAVFQLIGISPQSGLGSASPPGAQGSSVDAQRTLEDLSDTREETGADSTASRLVEEQARAPEKQFDNAEKPQPGDTIVLAQGDAGTQLSTRYTGIPLVDNAVQKWRENPSLMLYKLQANGYKFSWLLIPLSIPFVWMLFAWKRRFRAYDHAIFVTYSLAFMSLLFIALSALYAFEIGGGWIFLLLVLVPPIHIYKQLRGAYELSRFSAFWRMVVLVTVIVFIVLWLYLWLLVLLGTL